MQRLIGKVDAGHGAEDLFILFIYYLWLRWVFVVAHGHSLVVESGGATLRCGARASHCGGFSLRSMGSRRAGFSSCGMWLSSCGARV